MVKKLNFFTSQVVVKYNIYLFAELNINRYFIFC